MSESKLEKFSFDLCMKIIAELDISIRSFLKVQDIKKCSLVTVYNTILTIMILMSKISDGADFQPTLDILNFFVNLLKEMSSSWEIASKYYNSIMNKYSSLIKEFMQNKDTPMGASDIKHNILVRRGSQTEETSGFPVDFDADLFRNEDMSNIFYSILGEMPNFDEGGFVGFDFSSDMYHRD